jgi:hypothetical protein
MERVDIHVALEICEIVIESATIVAILESGSKHYASVQIFSGFVSSVISMMKN